MTSVWVGHPKDPYPLGPNAQGGAIAAPIWGAYMKSAKGKFCGDFPKPKVPFSPQPFFGKYSHMAVPKTGKNGNQTQDKQGKRGDNGQGTDNKNGGGAKYPPDAYESPPQGDPNTQQPPGGQTTPGGGTNGGTGAPSPSPG